MNAPYFLAHIWLIPLFPLLTAAVMLFFGRKLANNVVSYLCAGSVFVSFIFSVGSVFSAGGAAGRRAIFCEDAFSVAASDSVPHGRRAGWRISWRSGNFRLIRFRR